MKLGVWGRCHPNHMRIAKSAENQSIFWRAHRFFPNARTALRAFLSSVMKPGDLVLLPAYIGWSVREGSGIYDPIRELDLRVDFYRVTKCLWIDLKDLEEKLDQSGARVLILVHYFGYVDPAYPEAVELAHSRGILVLEDEAHSMLTHLVGGRTGRLGDACIFSLHKLLPVDHGGLLLVRKDREDLLSRVSGQELDVPLPWEFDLAAISARRRQNAVILAQLLESLDGQLSSLRSVPQSGEVPQTYPVVLHSASRDWIYDVMNKAGYGVVSLYYRLIEPIGAVEFPLSHYISKRILNLPVHQDAEERELVSMVGVLSRVLNEREGET